ncbi:MAG: hypothetical protein M3Y35_05540 [Actinomycetota bacterium]|nr:hypothetical protein [Actinomycetota bacterium]
MPSADSPAYAQAQPFLPDVAAVVWPNAGSAARGARWSDIATGPWEFPQADASRARVLVAVNQDVVVAAWAITGYSCGPATTPQFRAVTVCTFDIERDPRADTLVGRPSPVIPRTHQRSVIPLRDLAGYGSDDLATATSPYVPVLGVRTAVVGEYALAVHLDGTAEVTAPPGGSVTVHWDQSDEPAR